jgi:hypothetical protein
MKVNVYDFDKTILPYDSSLAFFRFCARRYPRAVLRALPGVLKLPLYPVGLVSKTALKESWYGYLTMIPDVDRELGLSGRKTTGTSRVVSDAPPAGRHRYLGLAGFLRANSRRKTRVRLIASGVSRYTGL